MTTKKVPEVKAQGDKPAEPEKVQASHILIKAGEKREVPKLEDVVKYMKNNAERQFVQEFLMNNVKAAKIEASEAFKRFVPPSDAPKADVSAPAEKKDKGVEKPAKK
jgi:hypothetical protein